jgi:glycosyltransferase involved in cell wall biosynthesis
MSTKVDCRLVICGTGEQEAELRAQARRDRRIEFLGAVSDSELIDLYAGCLAVVFAPVREDFGYVALEAFLSGKPVLTCKDSGEPVRLTQHRVSGLVCDPSAREIAKAMGLLASDRQFAETMGRRAREHAAGITWSAVASTLLDTLFGNGALSPHKPDPESKKTDASLPRVT